MSSLQAWAGSRRIRRRPRRRAAAIWVACVLWCGSTLADDYQQSFRDGIEAADRKDWSAVARLMQAAIADQPTAGGNLKIYGMRFERYLPYYYLGLAQYNLGDCRGALASWQTSVAQGVAPRATMKDLEQKSEECRQRLGTAVAGTEPSAPEPAQPATQTTENDELTKEIQRSRAAIERAARQETEIDRLHLNQAMSPVFAARPEIETDCREVAADLQRAQSDLERAIAAKDREAVRRAGDLGAEIEALLAGLVRRIEGARVELDREREQQAARTSPPPPTPSTPSPIGKPAGPIEPPPVAATARPTPNPAESRSSGGEATAPKGEATVSSPDPGRPQPPPDLRRIAEAFFRADYAETVELAAAARFDLPKARATAHLLAAAARYTLFLEGNRQDTELERGAAEDVLACRRLDSQVTPRETWFSPHFVRFFAEVRPAADPSG